MVPASTSERHQNAAFTNTTTRGHGKGLYIGSSDFAAAQWPKYQSGADAGTEPTWDGLVNYPSLLGFCAPQDNSFEILSV